MNIPIPFIGGGSGDSDECTATASDVLEGKTAVYNGSDDEPAAGTMKDYSGTTSLGDSSLDETNSRLRLKVPNTGKYDENAYLYNTYQNTRALIGLRAGDIAAGTEILGITGTAHIYQDGSYIFTTNSSEHSAVEWTNSFYSTDTLMSFALSDIGISDIGFTPIVLAIYAGPCIVLAMNHGAYCLAKNVSQSNFYYPRNANSEYSFSRTGMYLPVYYSYNYDIDMQVYIFGYASA